MIRVAIAEDQRSFAEIIKEALQEANYEVVGIANNGEEALRIIKEEEPDVVLLDMIMPRIDGLGVLEKASSHTSTRFMGMSAFGASDSMLQRAQELGMTYFLLKPFDVEILPRRLEQMLQKSNPASFAYSPGSPVPSASWSPPAENRNGRERRITDVMQHLAIPAHILGYRYIRDAVGLIMDNRDYLNSITKTLYPEIAKKNNTSPSRVERAIRHAIELSWERCDDKVKSNFLGGRGSIGLKPTNGEFLGLFVEKLTYGL